MRACPGGRYDDDVVIVRAMRERRPGSLTPSIAPDGRMRIDHALDGAHLDDGLAELLAEQLAPFTDSNDVFARAFTGVVLTASPHPAVAWHRFYRNSEARIDAPQRPGYAEIYRHALSLLPRTTVLDLGCGFGFLALRLADLGAEVIACDTDSGALGLLQAAGVGRSRPVSILHSRAGRVDLATCSVDGVAVLHVLEHIDADEGAALLSEALRVARRRVVVAVPVEDIAERLFGHVRCLDLAQLRTIGAATGWHYDVHEHHGGWLVLDRPNEDDDDDDPIIRPDERADESSSIHDQGRLT